MENKLHHLLENVGEKQYEKIVKDTEFWHKNQSVEEITEAIDDASDSIQRLIKEKEKALQKITDYAISFSGRYSHPDGLSLDVWSANVRLMQKMTDEIKKLQITRKTLRKMRQELVTCTCAIHCPTEEEN